MNYNRLIQQSLPALLRIIKTKNIKIIGKITKDNILLNIIRFYTLYNKHIFVSGVLEILFGGYGFLRFSNYSYTASTDDIYVSPYIVKRYGLRTGDSIYGQIQAPTTREKYFSIKKIETINYDFCNFVKNKIYFENLIPEYPCVKLSLENFYLFTTDNLTSRLIDLISPIGKGQRGLIVAPPKTGKTILLKSIATSIARKHKECFLLILLIDERPEEVTEMKKLVFGEVIASTFDEPASRHIQLAELVLEKAKKLVEHNHDVIILLDSITRLARAYNTVAPFTGRVLSGGIEATALQKPKRFFGAGRNTCEGGSLTIIATTLIETGSKMDDIIFEEFKGTGNMELQLDKHLALKRIFPAISFLKSGTRREELFLNKNDLYKIWVLRKISRNLDDKQIIEFLINTTKNNYATK